MQLFHFGPDVAHAVGAFDSVGASIGRGVRTGGPTQVGVLYLAPGGVLGRHPAGSDQLLMVVAGAGWVSGALGERVPVGVGDAAFWTAGEPHETGSETSLSAVIVEAEALDPTRFMPGSA